VGDSNNWSGGGLVVVVVVAETAGFVESTLNPGAGRVDLVVEEVADELVDASFFDELPEVVVTLLVLGVVTGLELGTVDVVGTAGSGTVEGGNEAWGLGAAARMGRPVGLDEPLPYRPTTNPVVATIPATASISHLLHPPPPSLFAI